MEIMIPKLGKINRNIFDKVIYPHLGSIHEEVIVPPMHGVDTGVIDLGDGRVLVAKTDPVFIVPQYGFKKSAWFAVHILASDVMTSGIPPRYALIDLNLPVDMKDNEFEEMWLGIDEALKEIDVMVVGGHTGKYEGTGYPMLGGFTMFGIGPKDKHITSKGARIGDDIVVTKGPAVEATALLVNTYPEYFKQRLSKEVFNEAYEMFWKMSCWKDGLIASSVGVHAMHDATEGGLWGALVEVAEASNKHIEIYEDRLFMYRAVKEVTSIANIDPYSSISEGTLVIATPYGDKVVEVLRKEGIDADIIGKVVNEGSRLTLIKKDGSKKDITHPEEDPFWSAFFDLAQKVK